MKNRPCHTVKTHFPSNKENACSWRFICASAKSFHLQASMNHTGWDSILSLAPNRNVYSRVSRCGWHTHKRYTGGTLGEPLVQRCVAYMCNYVIQFTVRIHFVGWLLYACDLSSGYNNWAGQYTLTLSKYTVRTAYCAILTRHTQFESHQTVFVFFSSCIQSHWNRCTDQLI